jgi:hypothetical protein
MALSNIRKEPRREITESLVGILVLVAVIYGDYTFAAWAVPVDSPDRAVFIPITMVVGLIGLFVAGLILAGLLYLTHSIGEVVCDSLAERGLELRPKQRY